MIGLWSKMYKYLFPFMISVLVLTLEAQASKKCPDVPEKDLQALKATYGVLPDILNSPNYMNIPQVKAPWLHPDYAKWPIMLRNELVYGYTYYCAQSLLKGLKNRDFPENQELQVCERAEKYLLQYLECVKPIRENATVANELLFQIQMNSFQTYSALGLLYSCMFSSKYVLAEDRKELETSLEDLEKSARSLYLAHNLYRSTARGQKGYEAMLRERVECLKTTLSKAVIFIPKVDEFKRKPCWDKVLQLSQSDLKPLSEELCAKLMREIQPFNPSSQVRKKVDDFKMGPKTTKIRAKKVWDNQVQLERSLYDSMIRDLKGIGTLHFDNQKILFQGVFGGLIMELLTKGDHDKKDVKERLCAIEDTIRGLSHIASDDLLEVYRELERFIGEDYFVVMPIACMLFSTHGHLDFAVSRLEVLRALKPDSYKVRTFWAYGMLLQGVPEHWLELEEQQVISAQSKAARKKERRRAAHAEAIKLDLERKELEKKERESSQPVAARVVRSVTVSDKGKEEAEFIPDPDFKSPLQEKAEQEARHAARLAERDNQQAVQPARRAMEEVLAPVRPVLDETVPNVSLVEVFQLKSRAKSVDEAIENETWDFTRDQLKIYLKALGCEYRSGKGVHQVVEMPAGVDFSLEGNGMQFNSTHILKDGKLITVFIDLAGGSFSLPTWNQDKGGVPAYLKKLIRTARNKIKRMVFEAQSAMKEDASE